MWVVNWSFIILVTGSKINPLKVANMSKGKFNRNANCKNGSLASVDISDVNNSHRTHINYIENIIDCCILCLLTAFTSAEHFPSDVDLRCLKVFFFFFSGLHVVTHMWNIPHIKPPKRKYEEQNNDVLYLHVFRSIAVSQRNRLTHLR